MFDSIRRSIQAAGLVNILLIVLLASVCIGLILFIWLEVASVDTPGHIAPAPTVSIPDGTPTPHSFLK